jgi:hypothetical protein
LLSEQPLWMTPTPEIQALHDRKLVVQHGKSKRRGYLTVSGADPQGSHAEKCSVAFCQAWTEGENAWAKTDAPIPTSQCRGSREYLAPEALGLIDANLYAPKIIALRLVLPPE